MDPVRRTTSALFFGGGRSVANAMTAGLFATLATLATLAMAAPTMADGPVSITLEHFGVGDHFRPGDVVGARFVLQGELEAPTPIEIAWELPDGNGDIAQITRQLVLDPGQPVTTWLYARTPPEGNPAATMSEVFTVRVWEHENGRRKRELGSARVSPGASSFATVGVDLSEDLIGVVGSGKMGLDAYSPMQAGSNAIPWMNSITRIARGIRPEDMPDRWEGLAQFSALIWSTGSPKALTGDAARALREWVGRGGLLVIVLPETADPWGIAAASQHPLSDLMPDWKVERDDAVPVSELLPILSKSSQLLNRTATTPVHFFVESGKSHAFEPLLFLPVPRVDRTGFASPRKGTRDGAIVGITRSFGHGRVTVIGIDVDAIYRRALQSNGLPQADVFWNRVLARRTDTPTPEDARQLVDSKRMLTATPTFIDLGRGELVSDVIGMRGEAVVGFLGAFLLFVIYWVVAGPGGYGILKWMGLQRHSWTFFVFCAVALGGGVWFIGGIIYSSRLRVQHFTVLDSIVRSSVNQPTDATAMSKATVWFSAFLPGYGQTTLSVDPDSPRRNMLMGWSAPPGDQTNTFPNPAKMAVPLDDPGTLTVAARATSASFEANWLGAVDGKWGKGPFLPDPNRPVVATVIAGEPLRVQLSGLIEHTLPGTLTNVGFIHITPIRNRPPVSDAEDGNVNSPSDALPNIGRFAILPKWEPNQPIELGELMYPGGSLGVDEKEGDLAHAIRARFEEPFAVRDLQGQLNRFGARTLGGSIDANTRRTYIDMLGIYQMLQPPAYFKQTDKDDPIVRVQRMLGRSIDLSQWFTTPCLIVWGMLDNASCPVPLQVNGELVPSAGPVIVRAIFPLPLEEQFAAPPRD